MNCLQAEDTKAIVDGVKSQSHCPNLGEIELQLLLIKFIQTAIKLNFSSERNKVLSR